MVLFLYFPLPGYTGLGNLFYRQNVGKGAKPIESELKYANVGCLCHLDGVEIFTTSVSEEGYCLWNRHVMRILAHLRTSVGGTTVFLVLSGGYAFINVTLDCVTLCQYCFDCPRALTEDDHLKVGPEVAIHSQLQLFNV